MKLPKALLSSLHEVTGYHEEDFIRVHEEASPPVSIRLNPFKPANISLPVYQQVPWCANGRYLAERPSFTTDPLFHAGAYYVQEASSMFIEQALMQTTDLTKNIRVLDLCAAPGGKSTLLQSLISAGSLLVSNEVVKQRLSILEENITKWGAANVVVTGNLPADFAKLEHFFDVIVTDVPCSGSGLFRKDPNAIDEWSVENVLHCSMRQKNIINDVLPALKPGGVLIYATCSYSSEENEIMMRQLVDMDYLNVPLQIHDSWNIVETRTNDGAIGYRFYPYNLQGEGFFATLFHKPDEERQTHYHPEKIPTLSQTDILNMGMYAETENCDVVKFQQKFLAFNKGLAGLLPILQKKLYIRKAGVCLGESGKNGWIPDHELAMSLLLKSTVARYELSLEQALQYLRCQPFEIETPLKGWLVVTYQSIPLGWIKALPNRINNYYPRNWRIINK